MYTKSGLTNICDYTAGFDSELTENSVTEFTWFEYHVIKLSDKALCVIHI